MAIGFQFYQLYNLQYQNNEQKTIEFVHIHQMHRDPKVDWKERSEHEIEQVARSQLGVASEIRNEIKKNPNCFIMSEGTTIEDLTSDSFAERHPTTSKIVKMAFPNGLSHRIQDLTFAQRQVLCELGAVRILLCLKEIKSIYKDMHKKTSDELDAFLEKVKNPGRSRLFEDKGDKEFAIDKRENDLIACIKETFSEHRDLHTNFTFLVIYGAAHKFEPHCVREGFMHRTSNELNTLSSYVDYLMPTPMLEYEPSGLISPEDHGSREAPIHHHVPYGQFSIPSRPMHEPKNEFIQTPKIAPVLESIRARSNTEKNEKLRQLPPAPVRPTAVPQQTQISSPNESLFPSFEQKTESAPCQLPTLNSEQNEPNASKKSECHLL